MTTTHADLSLAHCLMRTGVTLPQLSAFRGPLSFCLSVPLPRGVCPPLFGSLTHRSHSVTSSRPPIVHLGSQLSLSEAQFAHL